MRMRRRTTRSYRIGSILRAYGLSSTDLQEALRHQLQEPGIPLGEICVRLGYVPRRTRDTALAHQDARRQGVLALLQLARRRTIETSTLASWLTEMALRTEKRMKRR